MEQRASPSAKPSSLLEVAVRQQSCVPTNRLPQHVTAQHVTTSQPLWLAEAHVPKYQTFPSAGCYHRANSLGR